MTTLFLTSWLAGTFACGQVAADDTFFKERIAPILEQHCVRCHQGKQSKGGLDLSSAAPALAGGQSGKSIEPTDPEGSLLLEMVSGDKPEMPKNADRLSAAQAADLKRWIAEGASWPEGVVLSEQKPPLWSLQPLVSPPVPPATSGWVRTPIDAFILEKQSQRQLSPTAEADRRTLIRRLYFDLIGLPPEQREVEAFVNNTAPNAYENLVDQLLESPRYGERWARHWLDAVHYGDTHGYDKDKVRPNAWPYRDYVIRSFNEDKPYSRFVKEQLAGDYFYPETPDGIVALGFIAAGPFDFVGQIELREGTLDKSITRNLDRDDMVSVTMNTFTSLTAQCARCHDHKFDPITQEDYYSLQAVFAAVDRADRTYEADPEVARKRQRLRELEKTESARLQEVDRRISETAGPELKEARQRLAKLLGQKPAPGKAEFGYHSQISAVQTAPKWFQVDLGRETEIEYLLFVGCHDTFNNIGDGFGFPVRYKVEISDDPTFKTGVSIVADQTLADVPNPGIAPQVVSVGGKRTRYVRMTATRLTPRQNDFIFALAEFCVLTPQGENAAKGATITSLDSIEAATRWQRQNLVDGWYPGAPEADQTVVIARATADYQRQLAAAIEPKLRQERDDAEESVRSTQSQLAALPPLARVYAAATQFDPAGSFQPTLGKPRQVFLLHRGSEKAPRQEAFPGTVGCIPDLPSRFELSPTHQEAERRARLAEWIVEPRNPLTWRSIANRVWALHFGTGLVDSPNDFGRMGARPTHPELLDWLAVWFRDGNQSFKELHRLILKSAVYRQASATRYDYARIDGGNQFLWRMNRQRLDAEAIRDSVLSVSGKLELQMGGPGFRAFGFQDDHSPHYNYLAHDPDDPTAHRRSIYRFIVRSVPDPFMETLDCADPSLIVPRRAETLTALQALTLLNNKFMVRMAEHFAERSAAEATVERGIQWMYGQALGRHPTEEEMRTLLPIAEKHGLNNVARLILNSNEFAFVD